MNCPYCGADHQWKVVDSRHHNNEPIFRTRECKVCAIRVVTKEVVTGLQEPEILGPWFKRRYEYLKREGDVSQKERA